MDILAFRLTFKPISTENICWYICWYNSNAISLISIKNNALTSKFDTGSGHHLYP
jgi:hypothetical protein